MEEKHVVSILFSRYHSTFSNLIYWISGRGFTHASIALDEENEFYYSFNMKGFRRECPKHHKNKDSKDICYHLEISEKNFQQIKMELEEFKRKEKEIGYCRIGVFLCFLHISHKFKNRYFCSQFVAEMLGLVDGISLKKDATLYMPNQLAKELACQNIGWEVSYHGQIA